MVLINFSDPAEIFEPSFFFFTIELLGLCYVALECIGSLSILSSIAKGYQLS